LPRLIDFPCAEACWRDQSLAPQCLQQSPTVTRRQSGSLLQVRDIPPRLPPKLAQYLANQQSREAANRAFRIDVHTPSIELSSRVESMGLKEPRTNNLIGLLLTGRHRPIRDGVFSARSAFSNGRSGVEPAYSRNYAFSSFSRSSSAPISVPPFLRGEIAASDQVILAGRKMRDSPFLEKSDTGKNACATTTPRYAWRRAARRAPGCGIRARVRVPAPAWRAQSGLRLRNPRPVRCRIRRKAE